jgi:hypothetical protein
LKLIDCLGVFVGPHLKVDVNGSHDCSPLLGL